MKVEQIVNLDDPRVSDYRHLTDVGLRKRLEPQHGMFLAESHQVIVRAIAAGYQVRSVLTTPRWLEPVAALPVPAGTPVLVADPPVVDAITGYRVHRGALAAMARKPLPSASALIASALIASDGRRRDRSRIAILENIVDHTNVGAAFRSAAAFGVDAVLVTPECADPLYRRSVRVSMGAVFSVPWTRLSLWPDDMGLLHQHGYVVAALTPEADSLDLTGFDAALHPRLAMILGTEGAGITPVARSLADFCLRIPMAGGVDSLNVAAAAAVAFYATQAG